MHDCSKSAIILQCAKQTLLHYAIDVEQALNKCQNDVETLKNT